MYSVKLYFGLQFADLCFKFKTLMLYNLKSRILCKLSNKCIKKSMQHYDQTINII